MNDTMRTVCKHFLLTACFLSGGALSSAAAQVAAPQRLRYPTISPDGRSIAFAAGGQLWLVYAQGARPCR